MDNQFTSQTKVLKKLLSKPENKFCADCKRLGPSWASINIGVFICIKCSGFHRQLGTHITKVKSTSLDIWPNDTLLAFHYINNQLANDFWDCQIKNYQFEKLRNNDEKLFQYIKMKYQDRRFVMNKAEKDPMTIVYEKIQNEDINPNKVRYKSTGKICIKIPKNNQFSNTFNNTTNQMNNYNFNYIENHTHNLNDTGNQMNTYNLSNTANQMNTYNLGNTYANKNVNPYYRSWNDNSKNVNQGFQFNNNLFNFSNVSSATSRFNEYDPFQKFMNK